MSKQMKVDSTKIITFIHEKTGQAYHTGLFPGSPLLPFISAQQFDSSRLQISTSKYIVSNEPIEEVFIEHRIVVGEGLGEPRQPGGGDLLERGLELELSTKFCESFYNIRKRPLLGHSLDFLDECIYQGPIIVKTFAKFRCQLCLVGFVADAAAVDDHSVVTLHYPHRPIFLYQQGKYLFCCRYMNIKIDQRGTMCEEPRCRYYTLDICQQCR